MFQSSDIPNYNIFRNFRFGMLSPNSLGYESTPPPTVTPPKKLLNLRTLSIRSLPHLSTTEIILTWDLIKGNPAVVNLTWVTSTPPGGVTGNLVTSKNIQAIFLTPDCDYTITASIVDSLDKYREAIVVNTEMDASSFEERRLETGKFEFLCFLLFPMPFSTSLVPGRLLLTLSAVGRSREISETRIVLLLAVRGLQTGRIALLVFKHNFSILISKVIRNITNILTLQKNYKEQSNEWKR